MNDFVTSVIINLKGNFERQSRAYTNANQTFVNKSKQNLKSLNTAYVKHSEIATGIGRKMGLIATGVVSAQAIGAVMDFDAALTRMQTDGRASAEQIAVLKKEMIDLANDSAIRVDKREIFAGFDAIVSATGDLQGARDNMRNLALYIQATGSAGVDAGNLIAMSFKAGRKEVGQVNDFLSGFSEKAKTGSVKGSEISSVGKAVYPVAYKNMGNSKETMDNTTALLHMVTDAVKNPEIAAQAMDSLISELQGNEVKKKLGNAGIKVNKDGSNLLRQQTDLIPEIYNAAGGDLGKLNAVFGESAMKVFTAYGEGGQQQLQALLNAKGTAAGMEADARTNAMTAKAGLQSIKNNASELSDWFISGVSKELAADLDALRNIDKNGGLMKVMGTIATRPFTDEKNWPERQPEKLSGEIKITIDQENRAKVTKVTSNNKDVNLKADNGLQAGGP